MSKIANLVFLDLGRNHVAALVGLVLGVLAALLWGPSLAWAQADIQTVAKTGDPAPGTPPGVTFSTFGSTPINSAGVLAVKATVQGDGVTSDNNQGIWVGPLGALQLLARKGDPAVDTPDGVNFGTLAPGKVGVRLNEDGDVAFRGLLTGNGITSDNDQGIWVGSPGNLQMVAREGDAAPGTSAGVYFKVISAPRLGATGDVAFFAFLVGNGVTNANDEGLWAGAWDSLQLVAREGDTAPGAPPGATYSLMRVGSDIGGPSINGNGEVAFPARLNIDGAGGGTGVWAGLPGNLTLVVPKGDPAPGTPAEVKFLTPGGPFLNDGGDVSFVSSLFGPDVTSANNKGAWAGPPGSPQLVIRHGDPAPGMFGGETVDLGASRGLTHLNANGLVTAQWKLTGSGVTTDNDRGIWFGLPGGLELIVREGDPAPGTTGDTVFLNPRTPASNAADKLVFVSDLGGSEISGTQSGIWLWSQGVTDLLFRDGDEAEIAPGDPRPIRSPHLISGGNRTETLSGFSDAGHIAFGADIPFFGQGVFVIEPSNTPPVADAGGPYVVGEGGSVQLDASGTSDPEDDPLSFVWDFDNDGQFDDASGATPTFDAVGLDGPAAISVDVQVDDGQGAMDTTSAMIAVNNVAPEVGVITAPIDPVAVGTSIQASANFTDSGTPDTHTAEWNWGDGTIEAGTVTQGSGSGSVTGTHTYGVPGVYTVTLTVTDDDGGTDASEFMYMVAYDPNGSFVTGGGWINSPVGAYKPDPSLIGKGTFGFVSKYKKGANIPTGHTEFQFHGAGMDFKSTSYQWLVIAGHNAKYKGVGTIQGMAGSYGFMLTAVDGQVAGGGGMDKFWIKIWNSLDDTMVIYDNQSGGDAHEDNATQAIANGQIVIHSKGKE